MMIQTGGGGPPDTAAYYRIAYVWVIVLYGGYLMLLWSRTQRVRARLRSARGETAREGHDA